MAPGDGGAAGPAAGPGGFARCPPEGPRPAAPRRARAPPRGSRPCRGPRGELQGDPGAGRLRGAKATRGEPGLAPLWAEVGRGAWRRLCGKGSFRLTLLGAWFAFAFFPRKVFVGRGVGRGA